MLSTELVKCVHAHMENNISFHFLSIKIIVRDPFTISNIDAEGVFKVLRFWVWMF